MTGQQDIRTDIDNRYYHLLMGLQTGQAAAGIEVEGKVKAEQSEQLNARRKLLDVERIAMRDKELNQRSKQHYLENISTIVHEEVCDRMQKKIDNIDELSSKIIGIDDGLAAVYDGLSVKAASIAKIEPGIAAIPWLAKELMDLANSPKYRKTDRLGKVVRYETLRMALSFFGIENLKLLIPMLSVQRWIPKITDPYPAFKQKLWEQIIATGISCRKIAELSKVDPFHGYVAGMHHEMGKIAISKMFFKFFDKVLQEAMMEAHKEQKREEHLALQQVKIDPDVWLAMMWNQSYQISANVMKHMNMKRVMVAGALQELADKTAIVDRSPLGRVLEQGRCYARFRMLRSYKLINMEDAKQYLIACRMPKGAVAALKTVDMRQLSLAFGEE
ncbi:HDOD domain-containing protein [Planctobacterium marinum]|uniref:HDOD domain-containing protein n=1 Tax=Planctobacterium marinum TaxID=1631968 RepID=UPI001E64260E|nr:HDOD domain-containing protein [Planctobacterium marinum]MCC2607640.1 HDOD domain-containing protein [Planctobacterium marinum]